MAEKLPIYSAIHKGQRRWLFEFATKMGRADFTNNEEVGQLHQGLSWFKVHIREHAEMEEHFIHPRLGQIVPGCPRTIEADHKNIHLNLDDILHSLEMIKGTPNDHAALSRLGHESYLAINRFISFYLRHIDLEEDHVQQILLNCCTAEELMAIFTNILKSQSPAQLEGNLELMLKGINVPETVGILSMGKGLLPTPAYQNLTALAERSLEPERWKAIKPQLAKM